MHQVLTANDGERARHGKPSRGSTTRHSLASQRAFSLVEILVALTILGIIGAIFTRIMISQGRFTDQQNAQRGARTVSRQALNILESELRMVQDSGGIDSATTDGKTIRVLAPYRFGLNCGISKGRQVVSMLPVDSLTLAQAKYAGFGFRNNAGEYELIFPPAAFLSTPASSDPGQCTGSKGSEAQIRTLTMNKRAGQILDVRPKQDSAPIGQAVFFFQRVTYTFKTSTAFPGQYGLFRTLQGSASEEIMAPFDSSARFRFWVWDKPAPVALASATSYLPSAALDSIRGIEIEFAGRSQYTPLGKTAPSKSTVRASIFFKNVR